MLSKFNADLAFNNMILTIVTAKSQLILYALNYTLTKLQNPSNLNKNFKTNSMLFPVVYRHKFEKNSNRTAPHNRAENLCLHKYYRQYI